VITRDLRGHALAAPVLYPGSIERTSMAEADEEKGYMTVEVAPNANALGRAGVTWHFHRLPARPLVRRELNLADLAEAELEARLREIVAAAPADAVLTIRVEGAWTDGAARLLSAATLRALAPATMNVELRLMER
jgi:DNA repair exonuclease SbcCD nuclease subunit